MNKEMKIENSQIVCAQKRSLLLAASLIKSIFNIMQIGAKIANAMPIIQPVYHGA